MHGSAWSTTSRNISNHHTDPIDHRDEASLLSRSFAETSSRLQEESNLRTVAESYLRDAYVLLREAEEEAHRERMESEQTRATLLTMKARIDQSEATIEAQQQQLAQAVGSAVSLAEQEDQLAVEVQQLRVLTGADDRPPVPRDTPGDHASSHPSRDVSTLVIRPEMGIVGHLQEIRRRLQHTQSEQEGRHTKVRAYTNTLLVQLDEERQKTSRAWGDLEACRAALRHAEERNAQERSLREGCDASNDQVVTALKKELATVCAGAATREKELHQMQAWSARLQLELDRYGIRGEDMAHQAEAQVIKLKLAKARVDELREEVTALKEDTAALRESLTASRSQDESKHRHASEEVLRERTMRQCLESQVEQWRISQARALCRYLLGACRLPLESLLVYWRMRMATEKLSTVQAICDERKLTIKAQEEEAKATSMDTYRNEQMLMNRLREFKKVNMELAEAKAELEKRLGS